MAFMVRYCGSMDARWAALALHFLCVLPTEMFGCYYQAFSCVCRYAC